MLPCQITLESLLLIITSDTQLKIIWICCKTNSKELKAIWIRLPELNRASKNGHGPSLRAFWSKFMSRDRENGKCSIRVQEEELAKVLIPLRMLFLQSVSWFDMAFLLKITGVNHI
jgi:hypothetical protein